MAHQSHLNPWINGIEKYYFEHEIIIFNEKLVVELKFKGFFQGGEF